MFLVLLWLYYLIGPFGVYLVVADVVVVVLKTLQVLSVI